MKPLPWKAGVGVAIVLLACAQQAPADDPPAYDVMFKARLLPAEAMAQVSIEIIQASHVLRALDLNAPASRYADFSGDGSIAVTNERVEWLPPETGGVLHYTVAVDRLRGGVHDMRLTADWGVFRLDHLFPRANARTLVGAESTSTLALEGPVDWSFETPYGPANDADKPVSVINTKRRFDRPMGWAIAGKLGIRRDRIAERRVAVAAPVNTGFRRQDTLAFLRWTLPTLIDIFPTFPSRLLVVGSGEKMWRGGLSAPASLYLHPTRPLVSGNATSTLLHELVHVAIATPAAQGDDWIVEGLAEYYSLEILRRSGGISERRFEDALEHLAQWSTREDGRLTDPSSGANTAYAAGVIQRIAADLQSVGQSLDTVVQGLIDTAASTGALDREALKAEIERAGGSSTTLEKAASETRPSQDLR